MPRDVGLGFPLDEIPAGRFDSERQGSAKFTEALTLDRREWMAKRPKAVHFARPRRGSRAEVAGDTLVVAQFIDDPGGIVVPTTLLELKSESREFFLEHSGALHVVGDHRAADAVDEEEDRRHLGPEVDREIPSRSEPSHRVGPSKNHRVELVGV